MVSARLVPRASRVLRNCAARSTRRARSDLRVRDHVARSAPQRARARAPRRRPARGGSMTRAASPKPRTHALHLGEARRLGDGHRERERGRRGDGAIFCDGCTLRARTPSADARRRTRSRTRALRGARPTPKSPCTKSSTRSRRAARSARSSLGVELAHAIEDEGAHARRLDVARDARDRAPRGGRARTGARRSALARVAVGRRLRGSESGATRRSATALEEIVDAPRRAARSCARRMRHVDEALLEARVARDLPACRPRARGACATCRIWRARGRSRRRAPSPSARRRRARAARSPYACVRRSGDGAAALARLDAPDVRAARASSRPTRAR